MVHRGFEQIDYLEILAAVLHAVLHCGGLFFFSFFLAYRFVLGKDIPKRKENSKNILFFTIVREKEETGKRLHDPLDQRVIHPDDDRPPLKHVTAVDSIIPLTSRR